MTIPQLTKAQRKELVDEWKPPEGFELIDHTFELGMDNHGVNICLVVIKRTSDGELFGVPHGYSSEESFWGGDYTEDNINDAMPLQPLIAREVKVTQFVTPNGKEPRVRSF